MRDLVTFFIRYREITDPQAFENIELKKKLRYLEACLASKTPINEAEYAFTDQTPLKLYDCIIPSLKEHRKVKVDPTKSFLYVFDDNQAKAQVLAIKRELKQMNYSKIVYEKMRAERIATQ